MIQNTIKQFIERTTNLSDMADHIGKSRPTLYSYIDNTSQPDKDTALKIAQFLNVSVTDIFTLDLPHDERTDSSEPEAKD